MAGSEPARSAAGARFPRLVLFDLDGTLLDSAPDMLAAVNALRSGRGEDAVTLAQLRPHVSRGARAMLAASFPALDDAGREALVQPFLDAYEREIGLHGRPFDGVEDMLATLEADGARWGIVTNKPEYLARQVLPALGWESRSAILVGGDTLAERKPHPLPLLHSAQVLGFEPSRCAYVGDDERDIVAARAAGMPSVVALWGYRLRDDDPVAWQGDVMAGAPRDLLDPSVWPVPARAAASP
ncbi:phosphoglycolate phosphatase [Luteimonas lutimaris]|uniref:Phosphoglycolate phosphatase n=1 Tax=Luteimonas lutimaris TaxID=698645 RepID=A0ABP7MUZ8_9GAMM